MSDVKSIEKDVAVIAEHVYDIQSNLPDEEKWGAGAKLRSAAIDLIFYVSQGANAASAAFSQNDWNMARKCAASLRSVYIFTSKQYDSANLDPEIIVKIDNLIKNVDKYFKAARQATQKEMDDELDHWRKKYAVWKEMQS